ncbi:MAG: large conductance mechanosensitive channel protein MscL [Propionibacteriaceae bacterium]
MKGFKDFLLRGNLIELATAFIMGGAFATVVTAFTKIIMDVIGKIGGQPNFDNVAIADVNIGKFITALVSFIIMAAVVYFGVVKPSEALKDRMKKEDAEAVESTDDILSDIRELLAKK